MTLPCLKNPAANLYVPSGDEVAASLHRTTHLGIGAHQDDLEFMAMHGILECYRQPDKWFSGITCTNGSGSARTGPFANISDEEMMGIRAEEQREAARVGEYSFMAQLGYASSDIKGELRDAFVEDLMNLIDAAAPDVIYTHNPADKHSTHIAVVTAVVAAIRLLPEDRRPHRLIGCEGWRDLDWLPDGRKLVMNVDPHPELAMKLNAIFRSQISGGKRYDLAVQGRRRANATFFDSHSVDACEASIYAMDLSPLMQDDSLSLSAFTLELVDAFRADVAGKLRGSDPHST